MVPYLGHHVLKISYLWQYALLFLHVYAHTDHLNKQHWRQYKSIYNGDVVIYLCRLKVNVAKKFTVKPQIGDEKIFVECRLTPYEIETLFTANILDPQSLMNWTDAATAERHAHTNSLMTNVSLEPSKNHPRWCWHINFSFITTLQEAKNLTIAIGRHISRPHLIVCVCIMMWSVAIAINMFCFHFQNHNQIIIKS